MAKTFEYIEVEYNQKDNYLDQLNNYGRQGCEFCFQAQRLGTTLDFKTGQKQIIIITVFKREAANIPVKHDTKITN